MNPGRARRAAAGVVVDADPCEQRDLFQAQALDPAIAAERHAGLAGGDPCPPEGEELADLCSVVRDSTVGDRGQPGRYRRYL
jgi:hypothetical protein